MQSNYTVTCGLYKVAPIDCNTKDEAIAAYNTMLAAGNLETVIADNRNCRLYTAFRSELIEVSPSDY